ncbi:TLD-domain-containing protein [Dendrothele bispora CBS 962.96]|uniref:Oxidation resistance protein 1 n=1 Tax=Dendrothele bispora (strain CBS 962.96) TaxID=1314807 RepID=A0A4S8MNI0_DENBC|nr:TLD-domain-containing protein [Dendrothele bispora CBS 962.96]
MEASLALQPSSAQIEEEKKRREEEAMFDKFAILFSPPTPRASPTPDAASDDIWKPSSRPTEYHEPPTSPDSEFGSFVSVPASEDPLGSFSSLNDVLPTSSSQSKNPSRPRHAQNPSLDFFDKLGQEAKERDKRGLLDELLLHEDDPLYWLKDGESSGAQGRSNSSAVTESSTKESGKASAVSAPLIDLDFDLPPVRHPTEMSPTHQTRHQNMPLPARSPTRTSTLALAHTLAPPVASISPASSSPTSSIPDSSAEPRPSMPLRSSSYQTLSSISSRWMSSFTAPRNSSSPPPSTLESLFAPSFISHTRSSTVPSQTTHGTPFSGPVQHSSPFAPHVFVPASGAPGFKGESYDWDKGFSQQLDRELTESELLGATKRPNDSEHSTPNVESHNSPDSGSTRPVTPSQGALIGSFIEKKTGGIELKGRREATVGVLDTKLADEIRSHLPALSRLPRTWNLLYSLDQHGISLNTLYAKCEAQPNLKSGSNIVTKVGALVAMRDSSDVIFGAYIGDGVHKGRGYYGSGESFLWRYDKGNLMVFRWTGKNEYVALCEPDYLSFGGGDGAYGLYLDESLFDGSSARCPTFDNEPLCSSGPRKGRSVTFECVGLEVWGVGP